MIYKSNYKPRFKGYRVIYSLVCIADGVLGLIVAPFGYESEIVYKFSAWNVKEDLKRLKRARNENL